MSLGNEVLYTAPSACGYHCSDIPPRTAAFRAFSPSLNRLWAARSTTPPRRAGRFSATPLPRHHALAAATVFEIAIRGCRLHWRAQHRQRQHVEQAIIGAQADDAGTGRTRQNALPGKDVGCGRIWPSGPSLPPITLGAVSRQTIFSGIRQVNAISRPMRHLGRPLGNLDTAKNVGRVAARWDDGRRNHGIWRSLRHSR